MLVYIYILQNKWLPTGYRKYGYGYDSEKEVCRGWRICWWNWWYGWEWTNVGDPHYKTKDGLSFDNQGLCSYYLAKDTDETFAVIVTNSQCGTESVTCTTMITVQYGKTTLLLKSDLSALLNIDGGAATEIEIPFENENVYIHKGNKEFAQLDLKNGLTLSWDGDAIDLVLPHALLSKYPDYKTLGLVDTWNNNTSDDFMMPNGVVTKDPAEFTDSWKVKGSCKKKISNENSNSMKNPYDHMSSPERSAQAEKLCSVFQSNVFSGCHLDKEMDILHNNSVLDMKTCTRETRHRLCPALEVHANECRDRSHSVGNWRKQVPACKETCTNGDTYQSCGLSCNRTCTDINLTQSYGITCREECDEGCSCPVGMTKDIPGNTGKCIKVEDCTCSHNDKLFHKDFVLRMNRDGVLKNCVCKNGLREC